VAIRVGSTLVPRYAVIVSTVTPSVVGMCRVLPQKLPMETNGCVNSSLRRVAPLRRETCEEAGTTAARGEPYALQPGRPLIVPNQGET